MAKPNPKRFTRVSTEKNNALETVANYIVDCESNEYDSYISFCDENGLNPANIKGKEQKTHVYALALIGLGLDFSGE